MRMAGSIQRSTEVMKNMQSLVRVPEIAATMRELSKEMMKAGIIDEMIEETLESMEPEELEEEAQAEVRPAHNFEISRFVFVIILGKSGLTMRLMTSCSWLSRTYQICITKTK
jgi:predicted DNA-binding protein